jgi:hypothetical protein
MSTSTLISAAPGGALQSGESSERTVAPGTLANLPLRLDRIRGWHRATVSQAWRLKLQVFFTGMEIQALKADLGITNGRPSDEKSEFVSDFSGGKASTWEELIETSCDITSRTARNYVAAYQNMSAAAPAVVERIIKLAAPRLEAAQPLALADPDAIIAAIPEKELAAFRDAVDPWNLSELYQRPLKAAAAQIAEETAKQQSKQTAQQGMLKFWFDDFDAKLRTKSHLKLPRAQREVLLNTMEITIKELRDSLRSK